MIKENYVHAIHATCDETLPLPLVWDLHLALHIACDCACAADDCAGTHAQGRPEAVPEKSGLRLIKLHDQRGPALTLAQFLPADRLRDELPCK